MTLSFNMKMASVLKLVLLALPLVYSIKVNAQLFPGGDFENGPGGGCGCVTGFTCGNDAGRVIDGTHPVWAVGNNGCVTGPTNYAPQLGAHGGNCSVYFYAGADNIMSPSVNFAGGEEVCLSVWYCGPQGSGASGQNTANSHFSFGLDGSQIGPDVTVPTNTGWTEHTFTVIMTAGNHTFSILSGGAAQYSIWFDDFNADLCSAPCDPSWTTTTACSADSPINLNPFITGDTGGTWSGTGVSGNTFDPSFGTQSITYTAPCGSVSTQTITVTPSANGSWTVPSGLCTSSPSVNLNTLITGTTGGTWSGTGVTGNNFNPSSGTQTITYTVGTAPCNAVVSQIITVSAGADASWSSPGNICQTGSTINLNSLITGTTGGVWSGTGVTGSTFDPAGLNGPISITYVAGTLPCTDTLTQSISVITSADASWTIPTGLCSSSAPIDLSSFVTGTTGGIWSGTGITGNMFDPSVGTQSITYTAGSPPCDDVITQSITVGNGGDPAWTNPGTMCEADTPIDLNTLITGTTGGNWSGTGITGSTFNPSGLNGNIAITYSVGIAPCDSILTQNINIISLADPSWNPPTTLCTNSPILDLSTLITGTVGGTWSGTGVTGNNFDPSSGSQSITYTVGSGSCQQTSTQMITVGVNGNPSWTAFTMCASDAPVNLTSSITGDPGGTWSGTGISGFVFDPFFGTQSITYTVGTGNCQTSSTQTITVINPQLTTTQVNISCFGLSDGQATVSVSGGSGSQTYSWSTFPPQTTATASNLSAGVYTVTVMDGACSVSADVTIIEPPAITGTMTAVNGCQPALGSATIVATGGVGGFTYSWNTSSQTTATATDLDSAMHTVTVTDNNGCAYVDSILVETFPSPTVTTLSDTTIIYGNCITLDAAGAAIYTWTPATELDCQNCQSPVACTTSPTTYCVTGIDANGCSDSTCVLIDIEIICGDIFVPSAFSPNDDGENDALCVYSDCMETMVFTIYNRWGEKVFQSSSMNICWDGTWNGKPLNSAVFVYILTGQLINGESIDQKGNISLIR